MRTVGTWGRATLALMALASAGAVGALAASPVAVGPVAGGWTADPDDQFLLDVNIRQMRLGDGVRAYATPGGTCIVFGDFLTALDVPMKIDLEAKSASGWAFKEGHKIQIDQRAGEVRYGAQAEALAKGDWASGKRANGAGRGQRHQRERAAPPITECAHVALAPAPCRPSAARSWFRRATPGRCRLIRRSRR